VSLGTKVVTEKEQLAQHEEKQQIHRFSPFFLLLLLSFFFLFLFFFFFFLSFFFFVFRDLNLLFGTMKTQKKNKAIAHTPSNSDLTTLVNTADTKISKKIVERSE
jgi:cytoskeletal protein RodZ